MATYRQIQAWVQDQYRWKPETCWIAHCKELAGLDRRDALNGNCWDNAVMESFFKTLKVERIHRLRYDTRTCARRDIIDWIEGFYNRNRLHTSIGYTTPVDLEANLVAA